MDEQNTQKRAWYIVQSYSGCEYAAKRYLESRITSMNMQDYIFRVLIPETVRFEKKKNGEEKEIREKIYAGYIFVDMIVTDDSWFIVRNTPMVTGFLGSSGGGTKPVPLSPEEMYPILEQCGYSIEDELNFKVGDKVRAIDGAWEGDEFVIESIDAKKRIIYTSKEVFGGVRSVELDFSSIEPLN